MKLALSGRSGVIADYVYRSEVHHSALSKREIPAND